MKKRILSLLLGVCFLAVLLISGTAGDAKGTLAFLFQSSELKKSTITVDQSALAPTAAPTQPSETPAAEPQPQTEPVSYSVTNSSDNAAYIRAKIALSWLDADGNTVDMTADPADLAAEIGSDKWQQGSDGYYYYADPVEAGGTTECLLGSAAAAESSAGAQAGYRLHIEIQSETYSADLVDGETGVDTIWPVTAADGHLTPDPVGGDAQ